MLDRKSNIICIFLYSPSIHDFIDTTSCASRFHPPPFNLKEIVEIFVFAQLLIYMKRIRRDSNYLPVLHDTMAHLIYDILYWIFIYFGLVGSVPICLPINTRPSV